MAVSGDSILQAWIAEKQRGASLLDTFEQLLSRLRMTDSTRPPHGVVQHIASKVPCSRLAAYAAGNALVSYEENSAMELLSSCMQSLLEHQQSLHSLYDQLQRTASTAYQEIADFPGTDSNVDTESEPGMLLDEPAVSTPPASGASSIAGDRLGCRHSRSSSLGSFDGAAAETLRLLSLSEALKQELELTDRVMASLELDIPLDELPTYQLMWQLQPFLDSTLIQDHSLGMAQ